MEISHVRRFGRPELAFVRLKSVARLHVMIIVLGISLHAATEREPTRVEKGYAKSVRLLAIADKAPSYRTSDMLLGDTN
jgi:hypothetical protein